LRRASIDIGTNSVLLLVVEQGPDGVLQAVQEECVITRLGRGGSRQGSLTPEAVAETLEALQVYAGRLNELGVDQRRAIGTAALRGADNAASFLDRAEAALGCPVEVVSGKREAELALAGVKGAFGPLPADTLIFDIGGGSTELIRPGAPAGVTPTSLGLGCVTLTERWLRSDPPRESEIAALEAMLRSELDSLPSPLMNAGHLIGIAGTVTTLATIKLGLSTYDTERVNGLWLSRQEVRQLARQLASVSLAGRRQIPGLEPKRADVILAGVLLTEAILRRCNARQFRVCDRGVRWGLMWEPSDPPR